MWPAPSWILSRDPEISPLRCRASAGVVSRSWLPTRIRVGTARRVAGPVRSIALAACTSLRIVSGRQARSSRIPTATASPGAPGAKRSFFAMAKKSSLRRGPGRKAKNRSPQPSTSGSFTQLARRTRPLTRPDRWDASAIAIAPPSEWPTAMTEPSPSASMNFATTPPYSSTLTWGIGSDSPCPGRSTATTRRAPPKP